MVIHLFNRIFVKYPTKDIIMEARDYYKMNPSVTDTFNKIYQTYYRRSYLYAKSYVHDDLAAEDIASEALIKLWGKMKESSIDYVEPLLVTILKNKSLDYLRHLEVERQAFENMTDWEKKEIAIRISSLEACEPDEIFSGEIQQIVSRTLKGLSEQTHRIFILSRFENMSNKEIALQMNMSVKAVEYHISKALRALRIALKDYLPLFYFLFG